MSEENHVKEYKNKVKILKQKELIIAFNNANPDRAKSKAEREQDEYFEAKKKALKEHFDAEVKNFEREWKDKLLAYKNANKNEKSLIINQFIEQNNISRNKQNKDHYNAYKKALRLLNRDHYREYKKRYDEENKEKVNEYSKNRMAFYRKNNINNFLEKQKESAKKYYEKNKENQKLLSKIKYEKNKEKIKAQRIERYQKQKALKLQQQLILDNGSK